MFIEFINYMLKTWIEGEGAQGPLFKIAWWNHWKHLETRTNNTNEAYNFRLVVKMGTQLHPNIWLWVEFIQEENLQMAIKCASIKLNTYKARNRTAELKKDLKISEAKVIYLKSNRGFAAVEALLETYRDLCPKPLFSSH